MIFGAVTIYGPRLSDGPLGFVAVEGIAFLPEVAEVCLGVGVTCAAESHVYHCCAP